MASTSSGLSKKILLDLLDDQPGLRADSLDWSVRAHPVQQLPATAVKQPQAQPTPAAPAHPLMTKPKGQIFRSKTTFKQLLAEYNKPHQAPLIKADRVQDYVPSRRPSGFAPEPVEHIELPNIPGKILRPS